MSKLFAGLILFLLVVGCGKEPAPTVEPSPETTPWLYPDKQIEMLKISDFKIRALAAKNLGKMGAKAESALPELEKLLEDENDRVREIAKEAIEKIRADLAESGAG